MTLIGEFSLTPALSNTASPVRQATDAKRDAFLQSQDVTVLRFWSSHLRRDKKAIRNRIWRALQARAPRPLPDYCRPGLVAAGKDIRKP